MRNIIAALALVFVVLGLSACADGGSGIQSAGPAVSTYNSGGGGAGGGGGGM
jgi:hypothetical protein